PIPITRPMILALQKTDKRCAPVELTDEDKKALTDLGALVEAIKAKAAAAAEAGAAAPEAEAGEEVAAPPADEALEDAAPTEEEGEEKAE
ncbi:MAG: hypothetical protein D3908_06555, partial [Candidatus Electrothrix sp. AUS4]|nr:hypothetical protein [Candidatus Electrothrix sp. AUS4]